MRVITWSALADFASRHPASDAPLRLWYKITRNSHWTTFAHVKATFGQTDLVRVRSGQSVCVFDVGGNKYRLVAYVSYAKAKVYVLRVMTHKEYDQGKQRWKDSL